MDNFQPSTGSAFNPHQMMGGPDSDEQRAERRVVLKGVLAAVGGMISYAGVDLLIAHESITTILTGILLVIAGLIPSAWFAWKLFFRLVQLRRIHLGLCAHCKYETRVCRKGRCPECGKDPCEPK